jgi:hypothetical protein
MDEEISALCSQFSLLLSTSNEAVFYLPQSGLLKDVPFFTAKNGLVAKNCEYCVELDVIMARLIFRGRHDLIQKGFVRAMSEITYRHSWHVKKVHVKLRSTLELTFCDSEVTFANDKIVSLSELLSQLDK